MPIELLEMNHRDAIIDAFENVKQQIRIISPFVQEGMSKYLVESMNRGITSHLITRFYREDFIRAVSSLTALKSLCSSGTEIYAVKDLHTKLYLFDDNIAIVGSANFTSSGFGRNIELSLYIEDEYDLLEQLSEHFDQLLADIQSSSDFRVDEAKIENEMSLVQKSVKGRDHTSQPNPARFGADLKRTLPDILPVDDVEKILEIKDANVLAALKFEGSSHSRIDPNSIYKPGYFKQGGFYITASPVAPRSLTSATTIFLCAVSWDRSGAGTPIIVGRAKTKGYEESNVVDSNLFDEHSWAENYPFYIELYNIETVNTEVINCVSLNDLIAEVGYKLYPNTEHNPMTTIKSIRTRHHQKPYIAITSFAANRLNTMLESLFSQYGKLEF